jgi:hypothetical protein
MSLVEGAVNRQKRVDKCEWRSAGQEILLPRNQITFEDIIGARRISQPETTLID